MMKKLLFLPLFILASVSISAQTLSLGDIVVIGYASDTGTSSASFNEFSWVPLVDLQEGTKIYFTDAGYNAADANFMSTGLLDEILLRYIAPQGGVSAGTVFTLTEQTLPDDYTVITGTKFGNDYDQMLSLPNAGDQITVFQSEDDETVPATFGNTSFHPIFMVTGSSLSFTALTSNTAGIVVYNVDNVTNLVPGLTDGVNAVAVGTGPLEADETDNARYVGITSGTKEELLAAVTQVSNWSRHDVAFGNDLVFGTTANGWTTNGALVFTVEGLSNPSWENGFDKLSLYPNPAAQKFSISNKSGEPIQQIHLYTNTGQLLKQFDATQDSFDVSHLATGIYFVQITLQNATVTKKLIR